ncbi:conjugal transfer protein TraT [Sulfurimonas sediminis]|uniref:Conjugal transfer protein TraT n=1 Tax=Sulfurimonas sediminis TaxID=2590020 RepID=A0A7M1AYU6_9BACT|nr:complement resistance protein TraT [Sulfurimonas sediminis]QOP42525.1 conjugal transfer protein TraT [Sulfurimonas sediminis]
MLKKSVIIASLMALVLVGFSGCSAMKTAVKKRNLDVQTKMSETVFLEPVGPEEKIIYFDMRNTSDKQVDVKTAIANEFRAKGYKITNDPKKAKYMLQGNILKVGKSDLREAQAMMGSSFGAALTGGALGAATSYSLGGGGRTSAAIGLAGAALGFLGDALVEDTVYVMVTDLQIRERPLEGEVVTQTQQASLAQGSSTKVQQDIKGGKVKWKTYRTRIISTANKMNLKFDEARPVLEKALARSIAGVF